MRLVHVSVIGCGYLGAVHAAAMSTLGHTVVGVDVNKSKVKALNSGHPPFVEPGFDRILQRGLDSGRLRFTTDVSEIRGCDVHFLAVGTPQSPDGHHADLSHLWSAFESMAPHLGHSTGPLELIVGKSTVPVGTARSLADALDNERVALVWNPEFLREGYAVKDTLEPDRIVYGLPGDIGLADEARRILDEVYADILARDTPRLLMNYETAELVKVSANSFLAMKISFINSMSHICDATDADVKTLAAAIGLDERIGSKFLGAGIGFGGGCLPKDIRAFAARAEELGLSDCFRILREVDSINESARQKVVHLAHTMLDGDLGQRTITVLGASFKPDSDDIRDSPSLAVASKLAQQGAQVRVTDPVATKLLERGSYDFTVEHDLDRALHGADLLVLGTEWDQYKSLDPAWTARFVARCNIIDGRNCLVPAEWKSQGWHYRGIGRK